MGQSQVCCVKANREFPGSEVVISSYQHDEAKFQNIKLQIQQHKDSGNIPEAPAIDGDLCSMLDAAAKLNRRNPFVLELVRDGPQWRHIGLTIAPDDELPALLIEEVCAPSLVSAWNESQTNPDHKVMVGDVIRMVNEINDDIALVLDEPISVVRLTTPSSGTVLSGMEPVDLKDSCQASSPPPASRDAPATPQPCTSPVSTYKDPPVEFRNAVHGSPLRVGPARVEHTVSPLLSSISPVMSATPAPGATAMLASRLAVVSASLRPGVSRGFGCWSPQAGGGSATYSPGGARRDTLPGCWSPQAGGGSATYSPVGARRDTLRSPGARPDPLHSPTGARPETGAGSAAYPANGSRMDPGSGSATYPQYRGGSVSVMMGGSATSSAMKHVSVRSPERQDRASLASPLSASRSSPVLQPGSQGAAGGAQQPTLTTQRSVPLLPGSPLGLQNAGSPASPPCSSPVTLGSGPRPAAFGAGMRTGVSARINSPILSNK